eukprot:scaffold482_cov247-Pinguiococcus_pyrenoidosus.AAC.8
MRFQQSVLSDAEPPLGGLRQHLLDHFEVLATEHGQDLLAHLLQAPLDHLRAEDERKALHLPGIDLPDDGSLGREGTVLRLAPEAHRLPESDIRNFGEPRLARQAEDELPAGVLVVPRHPMAKTTCEDDLEPLEERLVRHAERISALADRDGLEDPGALQLRIAARSAEVARYLLRVWLDAPDVVRRSLVERLHQLAELRPELAALRVALARVPRAAGLPLGKEDVGDEAVARSMEHRVHVLAELVFVLVQEVLHVVRHGAGVVLHGEADAALFPARLLELSVLVEKVLVQLAEEGEVRRARETHFFVQQGQNALRLLLDEVQHVLVVNVWDRRELDAF